MLTTPAHPIRTLLRSVLCLGSLLFIACDEAAMAPPHVTAEITAMNVYSDCDPGAGGPGDFDLTVEIEEVTIRTGGKGGDTRTFTLLGSAVVPLTAAVGEDVDVSGTRVSVPFDASEEIDLRFSFRVDEWDGGPLQWTSSIWREYRHRPDERDWEYIFGSGNARLIDVIVLGNEDLIGRDGFEVGAGFGSDCHVEVYTEIYEE